MIKRDDIVTAAHGWVGTPYHDQATLKGVGADCLGLLRGIWRELLGDEPEEVPPYGPGWDEVHAQEHMLRVCRTHLKERPLDYRAPGTVLVFRMFEKAVAKHCGIVVSETTMIHAQRGHGVVEVSLGHHWDRRVAGVFTFPGVR